MNIEYHILTLKAALCGSLVLYFKSNLKNGEMQQTLLKLWASKMKFLKCVHPSDINFPAHSLQTAEQLA